MLYLMSELFVDELLLLYRLWQLLVVLLPRWRLRVEAALLMQSRICRRCQRCRIGSCLKVTAKQIVFLLGKVVRRNWLRLTRL